METRVAILGQIAKSTEATLVRFERRMDEGFRRVDEQFDRVDERFRRIDERIDDGFKESRQERRSDFRWMMTLLIGLAAFVVSGFGALFSAIVRGFHWLP